MSDNLESVNIATNAEANEVLEVLQNTDLTKVDRSRRIVKEGNYAVIISKIEVEKTKPTVKQPEGGHRLSIHLKLAAGAKDEDGKDLDIEKFLLFDSISLKPTDKYNPLERIADIQLAVLGKQVQGFVPADYIGRVATVKVKIEDSADYGRQNRVSRWLPLKTGAPATATAKAGSL